jgi:hypothetical protein
MHKNDLMAAPRWWLADFVQQFLRDNLGFDVDQAKSEYDRVIRYLAERSGLLSRRGQDSYAFWHLTFQEHFAAQAIVQRTSTPAAHCAADSLRPYLYHPRWTEIVRLVAAQLPPVETPALMREILDDSDPAGQFLHRGPLLALGCLADGAVVSDGKLVDEIFASVLDLGASPWLGITLEVLALLRGFAATRLAARARAAAGEILAAAEKQLSRREALQLRSAGDEQFRQRIETAIGQTAKRDAPLGSSVKVDREGESVTYYCLEPKLRATDPRAWYARARELFNLEDADERLQLALVTEIAAAVRNDQAALET